MRGGAKMRPRPWFEAGALLARAAGGGGGLAVASSEHGSPVGRAGGLQLLRFLQTGHIGLLGAGRSLVQTGLGPGRDGTSG